MRVKSAELKAHLSKYIQSVRDGSERIEVCVRDQPVAYLTSLDVAECPDSREQRDLATRLERKGLRVAQRGRISGIPLTPGDPGDHRLVENTIVAMRSEKDW